MIYLYAITNRPNDNVPVVDGVQGGSLARLSHRAITAIYSTVDVAEVVPTPEAVWQHEAVIEELMQQRAVLPVRFGTLLPNEAAVHTRLVAHYDAFIENLRFVAGRVEVGLRVLHDERRVATDQPAGGEARAFGSVSAALGTAGDGRAYMLARLAEERAVQERQHWAAALVEQIHTPLAQLAVANTSRTLVTPNLIFSAAYLIERAQLEEFRRLVGDLSAANPSLRILGTGPWPAYHFVGEGRSE